MDERNILIGTNLRKMYISDVVAIVSLIAAIVCILAPALSLIALLVALAAAIINLLALMKLRDAHDDYANAFLYVVLGFVVGLFDGGSGLLAVLAGLASEIFGLLKIYYIIRATNALLRERNFGEIIDKGHTAWTLVLATTVLSIIVSLVSLITSALALILGIAGLLLGIVSLIAQLSYLKAASEVW